MNTNMSAESLKPQLRVVIQLTTLFGMWSKKIAQLAIPRKKSSLRSRPFGGRIAGIGAVSSSVADYTAEFAEPAGRRCPSIPTSRRRVTRSVRHAPGEEATQIRDCSHLSSARSRDGD